MLHCAYRNPTAPGFSGDMAISDSLVHELDVLCWLLDEDYVSAQIIQPKRTRLADEGLQDPHIILLETTQGIRIDVESFVNCQYGYDIIDILLNLTVPEVHGKFNVAALDAGKHVYSEKPLAAILEDGQRIIALAKGKGLRVGCAPDTFLGGSLQTCRKAIDEGLIGQPTAAAAFVVSPGHEWHHLNPEFFYTPGGGPLLDIGSYYLTALVSLLGPVKGCCGFAKTMFPRGRFFLDQSQGNPLRWRCRRIFRARWNSVVASSGR